MPTIFQNDENSTRLKPLIHTKRAIIELLSGDFPFYLAQTSHNYAALGVSWAELGWAYHLSPSPYHTPQNQKTIYRDLGRNFNFLFKSFRYSRTFLKYCKDRSKKKNCHRWKLEKIKVSFEVRLLDKTRFILCWVILYYYEFRKQQSDHLHYERKKYKNHIKQSGFNFGHIFPENRRNALISVWGWCIFSSRGDFTLNWQNVKINSIQTALSKRIFNRNFLHKIFKVNRALHQSFRRRGSCSDQTHENISLSAQNK